MSTPRTALKGTSLLVDAVLTQTGYAGQTVTLDVEDGGRIVGSQPVRLPADGDPVSVRVRFTATEAGPRVFRLKVAPQPGEVVTQNNQRDVQIDIRDRKERILYYEGEPRFEMKFARQAIKDDKNLELVTLQRTAENKYLRLDIDAAGVELAAGFPKTPRGAVRLSRAGARQRRGERLQRRPAAHDRGVRRRARRRAAAARRRRARSPKAATPARRWPK